MEKYSRDKLLEKDVSRLLSKSLMSFDYYILQNVKIHPQELDILALNKNTLKIVSIEIKRTNWKYLFIQCMKAKLYAHFSIAVMPRTANITRRVKDIFNMFRSEGIGVAHYEVFHDHLALRFHVDPKYSDTLNRQNKKFIYETFFKKYKEIL